MRARARVRGGVCARACVWCGRQRSCVCVRACASVVACECASVTACVCFILPGPCGPGRRRHHARRTSIASALAGTRWYTHAYLNEHTAVVAGSDGLASFFDLRSQQPLKVHTHARMHARDRVAAGARSSI